MNQHGVIGFSIFPALIDFLPDGGHIV